MKRVTLELILSDYEAERLLQTVRTADQPPGLGANRIESLYFENAQVLNCQDEPAPYVVTFWERDGEPVVVRYDTAEQSSLRLYELLRLGHRVQYRYPGGPT